MSRLDELLKLADEAKKKQTMRDQQYMAATPVQSGLIQGVSRLAGAPLDVPPMLAQMAGIDVQPPGATQQIQKGLADYFEVSVQDPQTIEGDLITKFLTGATEAAPYAYTAGGPVLGTLSTVGAGVMNALVDRPFFDDRPLMSFAVEMGPAILAPAVVARAPKKGFDPQRPLTEGEAGTSPFVGQEELLAAERKTSETPTGVRAETSRSEAFEQTLEQDLNILSDSDVTSVSAARQVGERLKRRQAALRRKLSAQADSIMADIPDVKINMNPIRSAILNKKSRGALTETSQRKALDLYAGLGANYKTMSIKSLHEEMKRIGEVAYGSSPITETALYRTLMNSTNKDAKDLAKLLSEMPQESLRSWGKIVYKNMNSGLTDVIKEGTSDAQAARALTDFKSTVKRNIDMLDRISNEPLIKFFGEDFHTLDARQLADVLNKTDPVKVKQFSSMIRRSNPEAYEKLRETVFHSWLDDFKIKGPEGRTMFNWEGLTDPKSLKRLQENGFLLEGGDYTAFSQTIQALQKMQRKFDPDIAGAIITSPSTAQKTADSIVMAARAPAYKGAIVAQALLKLVRGLSLQNPKNLSLFNKTELQMINRVARGEKLHKESAEKLAEKIHSLAGVLFVTPIAIKGGRSAAAQDSSDAEMQEEMSRLDALLNQAQGVADPPELYVSP